MSTRHFTTTVRLLGLLAGLGITLAQAQTTLYADDFSGSSSTNLNSQAPDTRPGAETWNTSTTEGAWKANGSMVGTGDPGSGNRNAFLPFIPETGKIYTLSMTVDVTAGGDDWFALGFTNLANTLVSSQFQQQGATAWMIERADAPHETVTFSGLETAGGETFGSSNGTKDLKIVLDTTAALWTVDFFRDNVLLREFTYVTNPTINNVAIGKFGDASGTVDNFSLTVAVGQTATDWSAQWIAAGDVPLNPPRGQQYIPAANPPGRFVTNAGALGYHAQIAATADTVKWVQVDLGAVKPLGTVRLRPLHHDNVAGFGFPIRYRVEIADDAGFSQPVMLSDHTATDVPNPGTTLLEIDGQGKSARYVRLTGTRLFVRPTNLAEFCFGLRSLEVLSGGENIALNAAVSALDSVEAHGWSTRHLTSAYTPPVSPRREAVMMRRDIVLAQKPTRAVARVAGMGLVDFMINGRKAGDRVMAPALTDFTKRAYFDTYDVTESLREGNNTLAALLGNGHFASPGRGWASWFGVGNEPVASVAIEITMADGSIQRLGTDNSWKWSTGEITYNDFCAGETHDLRLAKTGWSEPGFDDSQWQSVAVVDPPPGVLLPNPCPPVRVTAEVKPVRVEGNKYIFDAMYSGWPSVRVSGAAGQVVRITGSANYQFTLKGGGEEILEPRFVIQTIGPEISIEGITPPPADAVTIKSAHADLRRTGNFSCSDPFLNRVYEAFMRTHENYTYDFPWDPTREKAGWTQDVMTMFDAASYSTDMRAFYTRWWRDFRDNQTPGGAVGSVIPLPWGGQEHIWNDPWWGGMIIYTPWKLYQFYGDSDILAEAYEPMRAHFGWLSAKAGPDGILRWAGASDWIEVGIDGWGPPKRTPTFLVSTCAWYLYADILRQTAAVLGKPADAEHYARIARQIRDTFNAMYFDPATGLYANATDSQTSLILPLALGMVPEANRSRVIQRLEQNIRQWNGHLSTGFVGTPYLLEGLADLGLAELSHTICTRQDYAGWNTLIQHGVMMETWNGGLAQMPSLGGSIGGWFFRTLGGIRPAAPGFEEILIKPSVVGDLTHVDSWHDCPHGRIVSNWKRTGDQVEMDVTTPAGTTATVQFPRENATLTKSGAGILQFTELPIHTGRTTVTEGILRLGNGVKPVGLAKTNELVVAQGAFLDLNYPGTIVIGRLRYNGAPIAPGTYNSTTSPEFLTGTGSLIVASVQTSSIPINNPSFESQVLSLGGYDAGTITHWTFNGNQGVGNTTTNQHPGGIPDGVNYAWTNTVGNIRQAVPGAVTLQADTIYTLTAAVGFRQDIADNPIYSNTCPGYGIEIWGGGVLLASDYHKNPGNSVPAPGTWKDVNATYTSPASVASGQQLEIRLIGYAIQTNYDHVRLTAGTVTPKDFNSYINDPFFGVDPAQRGFAQDPDGDALANGLEAWFGTHPGSFDVGLTVLSTHGLSTTFTHPRNEIPPSDLSGFYQWSPNLAHWYAGDGAAGWPGGPSVMITAQPAGAITTVTATASEAMESLFLRAGVARN